MTDPRPNPPPPDLLALLRAAALAGRYGSVRDADAAERGYRQQQNPQQRLALETPDVESLMRNLGRIPLDEDPETAARVQAAWTLEPAKGAPS